MLSLQLYYIPDEGTEYVELASDHVPMPVEMSHGRAAPGSQPDPPQMTFQYLGSEQPVRIGTRVQAIATLTPPTISVGGEALWVDPGSEWLDPIASWGVAPVPVEPVSMVRFTGEIDTITAEESDGEVVLWRLHAVGDMVGRLREAIGPVARPEETDVSRVQAIGLMIGTPITIVGTSETLLTQRTLPDAEGNGGNPYEGQALELIYDICNSSGGLLWQDVDGTIKYGTANHRIGDPTQVLAAGGIIDGLSWSSSLSEVINEVEITYGYETPDPVDPEKMLPRPVKVIRNQASIDLYGHQGVPVDTELAREADADVFAFTVLARRMVPFWIIPGIVVNSRTRDLDTVGAANRLDVSAGALVPVSYRPGPPGTLASWSIEGWSEVWEAHDVQVITFSVSDRTAWGGRGIRTWDGVKTFTWADWVPHTWLEQLVGPDPV